MKTFFEYLGKNGSATYYFHNLKFDGDFFFHALYDNGYKCIKNERPKKTNKGKKKTSKFVLPKNCFTCLIDDANQFYSIKFCVSYAGKLFDIEFRDSFKLFPGMGVDAVSKMFKFEDKKLYLDYETPREEGHILTEYEKLYIYKDVVIMARAIKAQHDAGLKKMTLASNALDNFINGEAGIGQNKYKMFFPEIPPDIYNDIKPSYKGGYVALNPRGETEIGKGLYLDFNSLYPSVMHSPNILPYGIPECFKGKYKKDETRPLFIQRLYCEFRVKKDHIPTISKKNSRFALKSEYIEKTDGKPLALTLTNVDLKLFFDHYEIVGSIEWGGGWKFKGISGIFDAYIDYWFAEKVAGEKENNPGRRGIAKLMLNALYGKLAARLEAINKYPVKGEDGVMHYEAGKKQEKDTVYLPAGAFITSLAREKTIRSAQKVYHRHIYSDTDSLVLRGEEIPDCLEIDPYEMGKLSVEKVFNKFRVLRPKTYIMDVVLPPSKIYNDWGGIRHRVNYINKQWIETQITMCGFPKDMHHLVTWKNFKIGMEWKGVKLRPKRVIGGTILERGPFSIKA